MSTVQTLIKWYGAHQALIAALLAALFVFVNSLRVALTDYPKTESILSKLSDLLSFLTHYDSPGSVKLPGMRSQAPSAQPMVTSGYIQQVSSLHAQPQLQQLANYQGQADSKKGFARPAFLLVIAGFCLLPGLARAQGVLVSSGPTLPLMEVRPGNLHPVSLAAGAGYQLGLTLPSLQRSLGGKAWDLLDLTAMVFGTAVSSSSGASFGALSAALGLCTLSSLVCLGAGHDIASSSAPGWFGLFAFSFNFDTAPTAPPVGIASGAAGLPRANTLYFGAP